MSKRERQSNIELLRIIVMMGVIILHYNNPLIGGGFEYAGGVNKWVLYFLESVFVCAVDLFVLISGYFMCTSHKRTIIKPLELIVQVIAFRELVYIAKCLIGKDDLSAKRVVYSLIPINWFVILYITLYLISPMLNIVAKRVAECCFKRILLILMLVFSVYPTAVDILQEVTGNDIHGLSSVGMYGSQWGYSIVNFVLMYFIGAYLRLTDTKKEPAHKRLAFILASALILVAWSTVNDIVGYGTEKSAWEYCNPIVIFIAVQIFLMFKEMEISCNRVINRCASASFTVYLIHNNFLGIIGIEEFVQRNAVVMLLHLFLSVLLIYLIGWAVYELYERCTRPIYKALTKKIPILGRDIYGGIQNI